jgi:hypothetical protein
VVEWHNTPGTLNHLRLVRLAYGPAMAWVESGVYSLAEGVELQTVVQVGNVQGIAIQQQPMDVRVRNPDGRVR